MTAIPTGVTSLSAEGLKAGVNLVTLPIADIKPYWRNPRRITDEAVEAVATSIQRYGYRQPIVVDSENTIIVGHTRLLALKKLGWRKVPVHVADLPEEKAKEYRLIDNRTAEMGKWDHDDLVMELREFEEGLLEQFFPEIDLEIDQVTSATAVTAKNVSDASEKALELTGYDPRSMHTTEVVCPSCFHTFNVKTRSLPGLTYADIDRLLEQGAVAAGTGTDGSS